jgi:membrane protease YdiL (CAAX protease family)
MKNSIIYIIVFWGLQAAATLIIKALWGLLGGTTDMTVMKLVAITVTFSVAVIAVFLLARWAEVSPHWLRTRPWMVLFWSVVAALGTLLPSVWLQELLPEMPNLVEDELKMILGNRWGYLSIGLLAPLAEEVVFRGAILRTLLGNDGTASAGYRPAVAITLSAVFFAVAHLNPPQMLHAFLIGLLLGWMYWRTGSILPGMAFHWANNTVAYVGYNLFPGQEDAKLSELFGGSQLHIMMALLFSLMILLPALYQLNIWMKKG